MFSLSTISVFATLAFGALSSALPLDIPVVGNLPVPVPALPAVPDVGSLAGALPVAGLVRRHDQGIASIVQTATIKLAIAAAPLKYVNKENATYAACQGPVAEVVEILTYTIADLKVLVGKPLEVILLSVDGTVKITVKELGYIVAGLICVLFEAIGAIFLCLGGTVEKVLFDLLVTVAVLVGELLSVVCLLVGTLVGDLVIIIVGLITHVIPFILKLNVYTVISILGLKH